MNTVAVIDQAIKLVTLGWCQRAIARSASGQTVSAWSAAACEWCLAGALSAARHSGGGGPGYIEALNLVGDIIAGMGGAKPIEEWNDTPGRTQAEVIAVLVLAMRGGT
jgi:hypothetical protein